MSTAPILVTGSHRSGTTWVGKMLALSPDIAYVQEPMNPIHRRGECRADFECWFPYITKENGFVYEQAIRDCLDFGYSFKDAYIHAKGLKQNLRMPYDFARCGYNRITKKRPLVKDPIALLSAEWLADVFNMQVVVMIRHPAAFVGSLKHAKWHFPFGDLLKQEHLTDDLFSEYREEIEFFARENQDIVSQGILLWNLFHSRIISYQKNNPIWQYVRHEDLSKDPEAGFKSLCEKLEIQYTETLQSKIRSSCVVKKSKHDDLHSVRRNSIENLLEWKKRLESEEIIRIQKGTEKISATLYGDSDW